VLLPIKRNNTKTAVITRSDNKLHLSKHQITTLWQLWQQIN